MTRITMTIIHQMKLMTEALLSGAAKLNYLKIERTSHTTMGSAQFGRDCKARDCGIICVVVIVVFLAVGIAVSLTSNSGSSSANPTSTPSSVPTSTPNSLERCISQNSRYYNYTRYVGEIAVIAPGNLNTTEYVYIIVSGNRYCQVQIFSYVDPKTSVYGPECNVPGECPVSCYSKDLTNPCQQFSP